MADEDEDDRSKKFESQEGEMEIMSVREANMRRLTERDMFDDEDEDEDDELDLDEIDEDDLELPDEDEEL